jgi:hypothetical protein
MKSIKQAVHLVILILVLSGIAIAIYFFQINKQSDQTSLIENQPEEEIEENLSEEIITAERFIEDDNFSAKVPGGWAVMEDSQNFLAVVIKPISVSSTDYYTYYAVNNTSLNQRDLEEYVEALKEELIINNSTIEFLDQYLGEVNGKEGIYIELKSTSQDQEYKTLLVFIADGEWIWALSFNTPSDYWNEDRLIFNDILQSFQIK